MGELCNCRDSPKGPRRSNSTSGSSIQESVPRRQVQRTLVFEGHRGHFQESQRAVGNRDSTPKWCVGNTYSQRRGAEAVIWKEPELVSPADLREPPEEAKSARAHSGDVETGAAILRLILPSRPWCGQTLFWTWKQPNCPLTEQWIKKMVHILREYFSSIKRMKFTISNKNGWSLEGIMLEVK